MTIEEYLDSIELEAKEGNGPFWEGARFTIKHMRAFLERSKPELTLRELKEFCNEKEYAEDCEDCPLDHVCTYENFGQMDIAEIQRRVRG